MKYVINVPNQDYSYDELLHTLKLKFYDDNLSCEVLLDAESYIEPDRKAIEDEVWEFASMLMNMHPDVAEDIYWSMNGGKGIGVAAEMTYHEAKAKYEAWKKQKDGIHVGDEVANLTDYKGVVVKIYDDKTVNIMWDNGNVVNCKTNTFHKTGRHFDEVVELLEKMKGKYD